MRKQSKKLMLAERGVAGVCIALVTGYAGVLITGLIYSDDIVGEINQVGTLTVEQSDYTELEPVVEVGAEDIATTNAQQETKPTTVEVPAAGGTCQDWMAQAGITDTTNAYTLIMRESGCNPNAVNKSSGACGIGQQLPCGKWEHTWNDPVGAMIDMQKYVLSRYGSWANAVTFHNKNHWY